MRRPLSARQCGSRRWGESSVFDSGLAVDDVHPDVMGEAVLDGPSVIAPGIPVVRAAVNQRQNAVGFQSLDAVEIIIPGFGSSRLFCSKISVLKYQPWISVSVGKPADLFFLNGMVAEIELIETFRSAGESGHELVVRHEIIIQVAHAARFNQLVQRTAGIDLEQVGKLVVRAARVHLFAISAWSDPMPVMFRWILCVSLKSSRIFAR